MIEAFRVRHDVAGGIMKDVIRKNLVVILAFLLFALLAVWGSTFWPNLWLAKSVSEGTRSVQPPAREVGLVQQTIHPSEYIRIGRNSLADKNAAKSPDLNVHQQTFMVFFAIFWGAIFSVQGRWKAFQLPLVGCVPVVKCRVLLSFILLMVAPVAIFACVFVNLADARLSVCKYIMALQLGVYAVLPAFSVFGCYRLWLGIVERFPGAFYCRRRSRLGEGLEERYWHVEPIYYTELVPDGALTDPNTMKDPPGPHVLLGRDDSAIRNIFWALVYIALAFLPWLRS
jgi:hypothetical protein